MQSQRSKTNQDFIASEISKFVSTKELEIINRVSLPIPRLFLYRESFLYREAFNQDFKLRLMLN